MIFRHGVVSFLSLAVIGLIGWEAYRGFLAYNLWRGNFAVLERWGGDAYFIPAVKRSPTRGDLSQRRYQLLEWAAHRYEARFPGERVQDLIWLPTQELLLLLRRDEWVRRLVILGPGPRDDLRAASTEIEDNAWGMLAAPCSSGKGPAVLLLGGGRWVIAQAWIRDGAGFEILPSLTGHDPDPSFLGPWAVRFGDSGPDGIPDVVCDVGNEGSCLTCDGEAASLTRISRWINGSYQPWALKSKGCGRGCAEATQSLWSGSSGSPVGSSRVERSN